MLKCPCNFLLNEQHFSLDRRFTGGDPPEGLDSLGHKAGGKEPHVVFSLLCCNMANGQITWVTLDSGFPTCTGMKCLMQWRKNSPFTCLLRGADGH